jgi:hypothetical protein
MFLSHNSFSCPSTTLKKKIKLTRFYGLYRYVDTFNQGGGNSTNLFQSPSAKPVVAANAKFFIPAPAPSLNEQTMEAINERI